MSRIFKKLIKYRKKINQYFIAWTRYPKYIKKLNIDDKTLLIEADGGSKFDGNCYYIAKEIGKNPKYANYKAYISVRQKLKDSTERIVNSFNDNGNLSVIPLRGMKYYKLLASAKYFFTDTSMHPHYIKKDGQIIVNIWHGTPLKTLGKYDKETFYRNGNLFKSFLLSDYILAPSRFVEEKLIDSMQINGLWNGKILYGGYPRNTALLDTDDKKTIREELNIDKDKRIYVYMPTFRGNFTNQSIPTTSIEIPYYLLKLDEKLNDNEVVYAKLHPYDGGKINYKVYKHIKPFPTGYETYRILNVADTLITDYSSVMFDFACTGRKVILFTYDKEKYLENRGMYLDLDKDLPFPNVNSINDLYKQLESPKQYDDKKFVDRFCKFDCRQSTEKILDSTILHCSDGTKLKTKDYKSNGKDNVILYAGGCSKNGLTSSLINLLRSVDTSKYNYIVTYPAKHVSINNIREFVSLIPEDVIYVGTFGKMNVSLSGKLLLHLYKKRRNFTNIYMKIMKKYYRMEINREFGNLDFLAAVQFNGYEWRKQLLFSAFSSIRSIFVHSNMVKEITTRNTQSRSVLKYCYSVYDNIIAVSTEVVEPTISICPKCSPIVINNIMDIDRIIDMSKKDMQFDDYTISNMDYGTATSLINNRNRKKIITVGRFSPEKDHIRLVKQFEKLWEKSSKKSKPILIIIGGPGPKGQSTYRDLIYFLNESSCKDSVILIQSVSNPYPFLKHCDGFILPSHYEGQSIALMEAIALGLPSVATKVPGLERFMMEHNGVLVPDTDNGVYAGLDQLLSNKISKISIDFNMRKEKSLDIFYSLLKNNKEAQ